MKRYYMRSLRSLKKIPLLQDTWAKVVRTPDPFINLFLMIYRQPSVKYNRYLC